MIRVLVADDDPDIRMMMFLRLRRADLDVHSVTDGAKALQRCRDQPFDVAVLDVSMPGLTGLEVARGLRADRSTRAMGIVLVSALTAPDDVTRGLQAGADRYLPKPFDLADLVATVCELGAG